MTSYRRNFVPGGCQFSTVNLADRKSRLLTDHVDGLRAAFRDARSRHLFTIDAIGVLPGHLQAIWSLPDGEADFATRWRLIKTAFSRARQRASEVRPVACTKASAASGNGAIGSTPFATSAIFPGMSITFISIR